MADAKHTNHSSASKQAKQPGYAGESALRGAAPCDADERKGYLQEQMQAFIDGLKFKEIAEYVQLMNHPRKLIINNLLSGIARGVGIAMGLSVFLVTALYVLRALGTLNLPIIGDYIADIVKVVQAQLEGRTY